MLKQELLALLLPEELRGGGEEASHNTATADRRRRAVAAAASSFLAAEAVAGRFVGCCDSHCLNMDKMSEAGLDLRPRGDG